MDQFIQAQSNIPGNLSGNKGKSNVIGSNNPTTNVYGSLHMTNFGVGNQGGELETGHAASRPYRLIPYCRNTTFTGRKSLLESVKRFAERKGHNRIALHGLGGSGKTQIALEYVHQRASETNCDAFWVQGSDLLKFSEGFRAVAQHVRIPLARAETDEEGFLLGIRRWFEGPDSGDWILVIDNADDEADFVGENRSIPKFIPQGTKGTLILTTRSRHVASRQRCEMIEVGKMGEEEAEELFSKRFGNQDSLGDEQRKAIAMILGSVHHLPLAVVGSAAFMTETATLPSEYSIIFHENEQRMKKLLLQQFSDIQRDTDMSESILGTHFVTFERIRQQMPAAADLLQLMVFFDCQKIPQELLSQCGLEGMSDPVDFRQAIGKLFGFSLVSIVRCENKTFYELHRLVQLSLQVYLPMEDLSQWRATALQVISRLFPRDQNEWRCIGPTYIPHALAVTKDSTNPTAEELCFRMGQYFLDMGSYSNAEMQFRRCITLREEGKEYDWDDEGPWRLTHLGLANAYQGKYGDSETINRRALEGLEKARGPNHPNTLTGVNNLAIALRFRGKYDESEATNRRALERREKVLGPDHPDTLQSVSDLAEVLSYQGKYDESETMSRRALEWRERVLGADHPNTLGSVNNLAFVLKAQGKYEESERMNRRALEGREKVLGPDHPDTLTSVNNMALSLGGQGKQDELEMMNRRALEGYEKILGPDHPDTLESVNNLAFLLRDHGKYDESEMMHRRALEGREEVLGPDHPDTLTSVNNLAFLLRDQGKYEESERLNRRALEGRENLLGPDHPDTLTSVNNLAFLLRDQGKYGESERMHRRALEGREKVLGPDHPDTLTSVNNLALSLGGQGKQDELEMMNRRALEGYEKVLGPDHPHTLSSVNNLAVVLWNQRKYDESERMYRRALEGREKVLGPDHLDTLTSVNNLAFLLRDQGKYDESEIMHRRVLEGREKVLGPDHPATLRSAHNLAAVLRTQGKYHESEIVNRRTQQGPLRKLDRTRPRFSLWRFLTATMFGNEVRPTN